MRWRSSGLPDRHVVEEGGLRGESARAALSVAVVGEVCVDGHGAAAVGDACAGEKGGGGHVAWVSGPGADAELRAGRIAWRGNTNREESRLCTAATQRKTTVNPVEIGRAPSGRRRAMRSSSEAGAQATPLASQQRAYAYR